MCDGSGGLSCVDVESRFTENYSNVVSTRERSIETNAGARICA